MASSFSATTKFVPYVPRASKPKPKPSAEKAGPVATTKTLDHSRLGAGSSRADGKLFDPSIFDLDTSLAALFQAADASDSVDHNLAGGLGATSESERLEHDQVGRGSLDEGGTVNAARVVETNLVLSGLLDGSSRESPSIVESDAAEEQDDSNVAPSFHETDYHAGISNEGGRQCDDLVAVGARAFLVEVTEGIRDGSLSEVVTTEGLSAACKRACPSSADTTAITSAAVLDVAPELRLESPHPVKRRKLAERQVECPIPDPASTPKPTLLLSPVPPVTDSKDDGARNQVLPPSDFCDEEEEEEEEEQEDGEDTRISERVREPPQSLRRCISPSKEAGGERDADWNYGRSEVNRQSDSSKGGESLEDDFHRIDKVPRKYLAKSSRRRKRRDWALKGRGLSQTALSLRGGGTIPTRASRQRKSTPVKNSTKICHPRAHSLRPKARNETDIDDNDTVRLTKSFQITDLTLYVIPKGSTIVTATIHYRGSNLCLNLTALEHELFGGEGTIIRITQLSPGLWMLLGYRHDDASRSCLHANSTFLKADQSSNSHDDATNHEIDHSDNDWDEEGEDREGDEGEYKPPIPNNAYRFNRDGMRRRRTRQPWLESDEERLLSYRDKMNMEWKEICGHFLDRSPGAVKVRYHMLHRSNS